MQQHTTQVNEPSRSSADMFGAPQGKHAYGGNIPVMVVRKNRAANKVARKSRRVNRGKR